MTPTTAAGRALLEQYPELEPMVYGLTDEPIVEAIEREAAQQERERIRAAINGWLDEYDLRNALALIELDDLDAILAEPSE